MDSYPNPVMVPRRLSTATPRSSGPATVSGAISPEQLLSSLVTVLRLPSGVAALAPCSLTFPSAASRFAETPQSKARFTKADASRSPVDGKGQSLSISRLECVL
jgi:hypothetical protein